MQLTIEFDREADGRHIAEVLELPGCLAYGRTQSEADVLVRGLALHILADEIESGRLGLRDIEEFRFEVIQARGRSCGVAHVPNAKTIAAMLEARRGGLPRAKDFRSLLAELNADA